MTFPVVLKPGLSMRNAEATTIPAYRIAGLGTPAAGNARPVVGLHTAGVNKIAGVTQHDIPSGEVGTVHHERGQEVVVESDGTGTIDFGQRVIAVAGSTNADAGRVAALPGSPTTGTNYPVVGRCLSATQIPASAGARLVILWDPDVYQG